MEWDQDGRSLDRLEEHRGEKEQCLCGVSGEMSVVAK